MRAKCICMAVLTSITLGAAMPDPEKVVKEKVTSSNGTWTRLSGRVKVLNAYTLRFEDGTEVDLNVGARANDCLAKATQCLKNGGGNDEGQADYPVEPRSVSANSK